MAHLINLSSITTWVGILWILLWADTVVMNLKMPEGNLRKEDQIQVLKSKTGKSPLRSVEII
jgi:hypothetical protein